MTDIVTLTMNPAVDISTSVGRVKPIHKLRCAAARRDPGGGGINVARVGKRLGADVLSIYPAGGPIGQLLQRLIEQEGVRGQSIPISQDTREDFTVHEVETGEQYRFVLPGPYLSEGEWLACLDAFTSFDDRPAFVVASGSLPMHTVMLCTEEVRHEYSIRATRFDESRRCRSSWCLAPDEVKGDRCHLRQQKHLSARHRQ